MSILLNITLGNPRQECRQFGICRMELWDGSPPNEQQCIARAEAKQEQLSLLFSTTYLRPQLRQQHFEPYFLVEAPYHLPAFMERPGGALLPGCYAVEVGEEGLRVNLKLACHSLLTPNILRYKYEPIRKTPLP